MKNQNFGIEIEMTGITRSTAAKVIAGYFHTDTTHVGGCYDAYSVRDNDGRMWKIMCDASVRCENRSGQNASSLYSVEFVTPICKYDDIETIQELVRKLRGAGARVNSSCGLHCHINAAPHNPKTLRNIVNIMAAKEDLLYKALKVNVSREHYCQKMDTRFLDEINNRPHMSMEQFKSMWYDGEDYSYRHYDDTRYHALNLHSVVRLNFVFSTPPYSLAGYAPHTDRSTCKKSENTNGESSLVCGVSQRIAPPSCAFDCVFNCGERRLSHAKGS